jgi:hypothetical protein
LPTYIGAVVPNTWQVLIREVTLGEMVIREGQYVPKEGLVSKGSEPVTISDATATYPETDLLYVHTTTVPS